MPRTLRHSLRTISGAFADIEVAIDRLAALVRQVERSAERKALPVARKLGAPRRRLNITPARRAQLRLQGAYMGYMRQLKPAQKARVRAVKEKKGFEAAIKVARRIAES